MIPDDYGLKGLLRNMEESSCETLSCCDLEIPMSDGVLADHAVPREYRHSLHGILAGATTHYWPTDLLFFLFYVAVGDALQILAGSLLFDRGWRYHKISRIWLARLPGIPPEERTSTYERGLYQYFDVGIWDRSTSELTLYYFELAEQILPPHEAKALYAGYPRRKDGTLSSSNFRRNPVRIPPGSIRY